MSRDRLISMKSYYKNINSWKRKKSPSRPQTSSPQNLHFFSEGSSDAAPLLSTSFDPSAQDLLSWYEKGVQGQFSTDNRDLAALLTYGPSFIPYVTAWTDNRIEQVRHFKHWVYVCINKIARKVASRLPNVSWLETVTADFDLNSSTSNFLPPHLRQKALTPLLTHEQLEPVPYNHPLYRLIRDPNEPDTYFDLIYESLMFLSLTGSCYWWVPNNTGLGLPAAIWVVPSHWMWPIMGKQNHIDGYEIRPVEGNYLRRFLPAEEIIHFRFKNPISKIDGFSPLTAISQWADAAQSINTSRMMAYRNGTFPTVAIQFDGNLNDPSEHDLRRIEAKFVSRYTSEQNSNKPLFLPPGVSVSPLVIKADEMVFGENSLEMRNNICSAFGVPIELIDLNGDTLEAESSFYSQTINPLCEWFGQSITEKLARRYDHEKKIHRVWWESFGVEDPKQVNEDIKTDLLAAAITPNEVRIKRGRQPIPEEWANKPVRPVNVEVGSLPFGGEHEAGDNLNDGADSPTLNDDDYKSLYDTSNRLNGHARN